MKPIILLIIIGIILYLTYFYSEKRRVKSLLKHIDYSYIYDKPRLTYDFCGVDSGSADTVFLPSVSINALNNTITIDNTTKTDFHKLGLSSEYFIDLEDKKNLINNNPSGMKYKIKKIIDKYTIEFHPGGHKLSKIEDVILTDGSTTIALTSSGKKYSLISEINKLNIFKKTLTNLTCPTFKISIILDKYKHLPQMAGNVINYISDNNLCDIATSDIGGTSYITKYSQSGVKMVYYKPSENKNKFKNTTLSDYYVSSSYNTCLIGHQILDYCSIDMIYKALYYGARYIELEIFDKEKIADTIPVVYSGYNDGMTSLNLNSLDFKECIKSISKIAFSKRYLDNYNEPLFLFLNIKTENYRTLDKIYDIIQLYLKRFLLDKAYNHINMGKVKLCAIKRKCVIFASKNYNKSTKLNSIINSAVDKGTIKRITYNEALLTADEFQGAKYSILSSNISFSNGFSDYITIDEPNINLLSSGLTSGDVVQISGADKPKNNSGEYQYKIKQVTSNKLVFDKSVRFMKEGNGAMVTVKAYDKDRKMEALEDYNKYNLTIVIPDNRLTSHNQNYKNIFYRGCQFVAMNFQYPDEHMLEYFNFFKQKSFSMKPAYLLANIYVPKTKSLNSMVPKIETKLRLNIDYTFFDRINNNGVCIVKSFIDSGVRLLNEERVAKLSISNDVSKSKIVLKKALNGKSGYISFENEQNGVKRYLCYNDSCCYLYFNKLLPENDKMANYASFIPLYPLENKKGFNSLGVIKEKKINNKNTDVLYYIKSRQQFSTRNILYTINKTEYIVKAFLVNTVGNFYSNSSNKGNHGVERVAILTPKFSKNGKYFPVGDIFIDVKKLKNLNGKPQNTLLNNEKKEAPKTMSDDLCDPTENPNLIINNSQSFKTQLFSGAVDKPIDYELIWDNKNYPKVVRSSIKLQETEKVIENDPKGETYRGCQNKTKDGNDCETGRYCKYVYTNPNNQESLNNIACKIKDRTKIEECVPLSNNTPLSIWRPIPNEGYMAAGVVCMNSYDKPSINDVVCISVDYLSESNIVEEYEIDPTTQAGGAGGSSDDDPEINYNKPPTAKPLWCDVESNLILWSNLKHNYALPDTIIRFEVGEDETAEDAAPTVAGAGTDDKAKQDALNEKIKTQPEMKKIYPPNVIDFKMYDFILDEKDYYDRLYLDSIIPDKKSREDTLFQFIEQKDKKEPGSMVYDYLLKKDNINGKISSYTKSMNGGDMCMALPQPYWSHFYKETQEDSYTKSVKDKQEDRDNLMNDESRLRFEACKERDYFGTNWNYYKDKSIRLEDNKDFCVTYNTDDKEKISTDVDDVSNFLFLSECNEELKNQRFLYEKNNLKVFTGTNYEPNACITHTPTDELRLEECGDRKYTALWKWQNEINRVDKCSRIDAEDELKKIGSIEKCINDSYYVVYLKSRFDINSKEYCSYSEGEKNYNKFSDEYSYGTALIHNGKILKKNTTDSSIELIFKNYATQLASSLSECNKCEYASKILCSDKSILDSEENHYENDTDKTELSKYCMDMKNNNSFKCDRQFRQNFIYRAKSNDFCLGLYKPVYIAIENNETHTPTGDFKGLTMNLERSCTEKNNSTQYPFDNLLGESYDEHYHIYIKGILTEHPSLNHKFKVVFDEDNIKNIAQNYIDIEKSDTRIILDYVPDYDNLKKGDKVIVRYNPVINDDDYGFKTDGTGKLDIKIKNSHIRWLGVIIKKLNNNRVKVMHSINSYESDHEYKNNVESQRFRPFKISNPISIYNVNDLILYKKAPLCL